MKTIKILVYLLILFNFLLIGYVFNTYSYGKDDFYRIEKANITRIIDGDTIVTNIGRVRLIGVNTPEKNRTGYNDAKNFLLQFQNKEVELVKTNKNKGRYGRLLRYVFYQDKSINELILENGLGHIYYYSPDKYTQKLESAEARARKRKIGIWQKSKDNCADCIILKKLNEVDPGEYLVLKNRCAFNCNLSGWTIKDSANHFRKLNFSIFSGEDFKIDYQGRVWNDDGDSLFLRDKFGRLVLFYRY